MQRQHAMPSLQQLREVPPIRSREHVAGGLRDINGFWEGTVTQACLRIREGRRSEGTDSFDGLVTFEGWKFGTQCCKSNPCTYSLIDPCLYWNNDTTTHENKNAPTAGTRRYATHLRSTSQVCSPAVTLMRYAAYLPSPSVRRVYPSRLILKLRGIEDCAAPYEAAAAPAALPLSPVPDE